ncbi:uncharacterized protein LOC116005711 [Ipomoea triloba]|uniref:uncharacterized protein LOC116005711 n=1 Tax=Ipomoea triloba TaxID=35885 RepID=UPI00125D4B04|nr:uncharacterized protein LOC116005711 [Ipomoea triloba]
MIHTLQVDDITSILRNLKQKTPAVHKHEKQSDSHQIFILYSSWMLFAMLLKCSVCIILSLQVFLMGICMPLYVVHSENMPLNAWDFVAIGICLSGIIIAYYADTQLHNFVSKNKRLKELSQPMVPNLEIGLWRYSRHPNYFGEQLWWWGLAIFAWHLGHVWSFVGPLINSLCLAYVTVLVEKRMLKQAYRVEAYKLYQKTTSAWIPWFKVLCCAGKDKNT